MQEGLPNQAWMLILVSRLEVSCQGACMCEGYLEGREGVSTYVLALSRLLLSYSWMNLRQVMLLQGLDMGRADHISGDQVERV